MAVYEKNGVLNYIDDSGNRYILYPVTTADNVDGLDTELAEKVDKTSIVDNLTTNDASKVLSAKQGKVLKEAIDNKTVSVDTSMSDTSTNAVQNKVIKAYVDNNTGSKATVKSNISVNVTPIALSSYMAWDTEELYGYKATITINGLTENSLIENLVMSDTLLASVGYIATTGTNSLTFYTQDDTALSGMILTLVTSEVG